MTRTLPPGPLYDAMEEVEDKKQLLLAKKAKDPNCAHVVGHEFMDDWLRLIGHEIDPDELDKIRRLIGTTAILGLSQTAPESLQVVLALLSPDDLEALRDAFASVAVDGLALGIEVQQTREKDA